MTYKFPELVRKALLNKKTKFKYKYLICFIRKTFILLSLANKTSYQKTDETPIYSTFYRYPFIKKQKTKLILKNVRFQQCSFN